MWTVANGCFRVNCTVQNAHFTVSHPDYGTVDSCGHHLGRYVRLVGAHAEGGHAPVTVQYTGPRTRLR